MNMQTERNSSFVAFVINNPVNRIYYSFMYVILWKSLQDLEDYSMFPQ